MPRVSIKLVCPSTGGVDPGGDVRGQRDLSTDVLRVGVALAGTYGRTNQRQDHDHEPPGTVGWRAKSAHACRMTGALRDDKR
jgi:hypothetical protein